MTTQFETFDLPEMDVISFKAENASKSQLIEVTYEPSDKSIASDAIKLYLEKFAETEIEAEILATTVADELFEAMKPQALSIRTTVEIAGLTKTAVATRR